MWKLIAGGLPGVGWGSLTGEVFLKLSKSNLDEVSWTGVESAGDRKLDWRQRRTRLNKAHLDVAGESRISENIKSFASQGLNRK